MKGPDELPITGLSKEARAGLLEKVGNKFEGNCFLNLIPFDYSGQGIFLRLNRIDNSGRELEMADAKVGRYYGGNHKDVAVTGVSIPLSSENPRPFFSLRERDHGMLQKRKLTEVRNAVHALLNAIYQEPPVVSVERETIGLNPELLSAFVYSLRRRPLTKSTIEPKIHRRKPEDEGRIVFEAYFPVPEDHRIDFSYCPAEHICSIVLRNYSDQPDYTSILIKFKTAEIDSMSFSPEHPKITPVNLECLSIDILNPIHPPEEHEPDASLKAELLARVAGYLKLATSTLEAKLVRENVIFQLKEALNSCLYGAKL